MPSKKKKRTKRPSKRAKGAALSNRAGYGTVLRGVTELLESARRTSARAVNAVMTATYWDVGRRIVEFEQKGDERAEYGNQTVRRLSADLTARFGRGFSLRNIEQMRLFYLAWPKAQTLSAQTAPVKRRLVEVSKAQTASALLANSSKRAAASPHASPSSVKSPLATISSRFPLPWSHYVRLLSVNDPEARAFYEHEALRGGWSVRQLDRQINTMFHERTVMSRNKAAVRRKAAPARADEILSPEDEIKDPLVLEFLDLKDEYSESELEQAIITRLEAFLLELGGDFAFIGRQRRLRIGDDWYRIDLLFYHRRLRCLVIIDFKLGRLTHADAGQMNMYVNYAAEHWLCPGEQPPVGLILCADRNEAVAKYALAGLPSKIMAAEYRLALPTERELVEVVRRVHRRRQIARR